MELLYLKLEPQKIGHHLQVPFLISPSTAADGLLLLVPNTHLLLWTLSEGNVSQYLLYLLPPTINHIPPSDSILSSSWNILIKLSLFIDERNCFILISFMKVADTITKKRQGLGGCDLWRKGYFIYHYHLCSHYNEIQRFKRKWSATVSLTFFKTLISIFSNKLPSKWLTKNEKKNFKSVLSCLFLIG